MTTLYPARDFYPALNQPETEVAIRFSLTEDLYTVFIGPNEDGTVTFKLFLEPLIGFVWLGGIILVLGSFIVVWPDPREGRILERARASEMQRQGAVVR